MRRNKDKKFTLIEVVTAIAILGMGLVTALSVTATVNRRMDRAYNRWEHQHLLAQALEYHLLAGFREPLPQEIFPYQGYTVNCEIHEVEDLPAGVEPVFDKWKLAKITATLRNEEGNPVETIQMEKILRKDEL